MPDPGRSWGDASSWYAALGGNNAPAVGSIAWFGSADHVAYVDAINGSQVHIMADNWPGSASQNGYTDSGWIAASSVTKFLHPRDVGSGTPTSPTGILPASGLAPSGQLHFVYFVGSDGNLRDEHWTGSSWQLDNFGQAVAAGTSPSAYLG
ncbi:MAG: CHAP domain-containing protein [Solirubrobacteraceae bacterium]|jgi:surface antigen